MPRRSKGPRLYLQPTRRYPDGRLRSKPMWVIRDGDTKRGTGFSQGEAAKAQTALANYILSKSGAPRTRDRHPAFVKVADVISIYTDDVVAKHARPHETAARLERVLDYFGELMLSDVSGARVGSTPAGAGTPRRRGASSKICRRRSGITGERDSARRSRRSCCRSVRRRASVG